MADVDPITRLGASEQAERIRAGELSARDVTAAHISRIESVNGQLNAVVIPLFEEALEQAAAADEALQRGDAVGPLHGVPVTIKEQYQVAGTQTTLGASAQIGNVSHDEGPLVTALRNAGAIILGKTNIIQTLAGWESDNPVYGRTNNPWNLARSPGGSSGGEAAIVAAYGSALGLGGDLGGSIRLAAHFCGVHGFKPTSWRLTNADFAPGLLSSGQEIFIPQPGPMARHVDDLMLAMSVLAATSMQPTPDVVPPVGWPDNADREPASLRVGMYTESGYFGVVPAVRRAVEEAAAALESLGGEVVPVTPPDPHEGVRLFLRAASAGGSTDLFRLLDGEKPIGQIAGLMRGVKLPPPVRPLVARLMEARGQHQLASQIRNLGRCSAEQYLELVEARNTYRAGFTELLDRHRLDAVICPPAAVPAFTHGSSEQLLPAVSDALVYNVIGAPAGVVSISRVRAGEETDRKVTEDVADLTAAQVEAGSAGLPVGVQVVGRHWQEQMVLAVMALLEAQFRDTPDYPQLQELDAARLRSAGIS